MNERITSDKYLALRLLVGYLGEKSQFGWWPTSFFEPSSRQFLEPVFPKTRQLAQYHGVLEAARRVHDSFIGVGNVFHLFRLPEEIEQRLHAMMQERLSDGEGLVDLTSKDAAIESLAKIANGTRQTSDGPISLGKFSTLLTASAYSAVAQNYLAAFERGNRTYPYFVG